MTAIEFIKANSLLSDAAFVWSCEHSDTANMAIVLRAYGAARFDFMAACAMVEEGRKALALPR